MKRKNAKMHVSLSQSFFLGEKKDRPFKCNKIILQHIIAASAFGTKCKDACLKVLPLSYALTRVKTALPLSACPPSLK